MGALVRHRDYRLLLIGVSTRMLGDSLVLLVFAIWVKSLTGSNSATGAVMFCLALPFAVSPAGGWLVDRVRRRPFLIGTNLASALILMPLLTVRDRHDVWIIYLVAALYGTSMVATTAALNGLIKELLADASIATANGALHTIREGLRLIGPLAGAGLFSMRGGAAVAVVDAVAFCVAAAAIALMRLDEQPPERGGGRRWSAASAGLRHLMADAPLRHAMFAAAAAWLIIGLGESVSFAIVDQGLHRRPEFIGVLSSAQGAGCLLGGLISARVIGRVGELAAIAVGLTAFGVGSGHCIIATLPTVVAGKAITGAGFTLFAVAFVTLLQRRTPLPLLGRASAAAESLTSGPQTFSIAVGAAAIALIDYRLLLAGMCTGLFITAALLWPGRSLTMP